MYKPHFTTFLLTVLALVASFVICSGNNGTNPQTGDDSTMEELSPQEKGMQPIYKLLHGFLETVMPHNFYSQDESPFSKYFRNVSHNILYHLDATQNGMFHVMKKSVISGVSD